MPLHIHAESGYFVSPPPSSSLAPPSFPPLSSQPAALLPLVLPSARPKHPAFGRVSTGTGGSRFAVAVQQDRVLPVQELMEAELGRWFPVSRSTQENTSCRVSGSFHFSPFGFGGFTSVVSP